MSGRKPTRLRRFLGFLTFRLIPFALIIGILIFGMGVANAVVRQFDERSTFESAKETFRDTATELAAIPTSVSEVSPSVPPTDTIEPTVTKSSTPTISPSDTRVPPSITPRPTETETNTPVSPTATRRSTQTPEPASDTPTTVPPTNTSTQESAVEATPVSVAQSNPTNTIAPVIFATNTPNLGTNLFHTATPESTRTPLPATSTPTVTATTTLEPTLTNVPSLTPTATVAATETPRPVPTVLFAPSREDGAILNGTAVPTHVPTVPREFNLVNIILLGGDDELTDGNFYRTDTMIIVSINRDTGSVAMLSLPRDLFVYIPSGQMNRLNVVYAIGESIGWTPGGGFGLLRQTILYNFGINVHYYARVNFSGFQEIINTMGGVDIAVDCAYQDYQLIGAEVPEGAEEVGDEGLHTLGVGYYEMDGAQALWYARTRRNSSDFDRGRRQQQLLRAIWHRAKESVSLTNAVDLWNQGMEVVDTDMGLDDFVSLLPMALSLDVSQIENYTLIRTYHTIPWQTPAGDFVQLPNYETMRPLLEDFYRPPSDSQILLEGATIAVYNGTDNPDWDRVAAERLAWEGFRAYPNGLAESLDFAETTLIDYTGQQKGSSLGEIAGILNVNTTNINIDPDPNREADFAVILGANYNSCDAAVLAVDE